MLYDDHLRWQMHKEKKTQTHLKTKNTGKDMHTWCGSTQGLTTPRPKQYHENHKALKMTASLGYISFNKINA